MPSSKIQKRLAGKFSDIFSDMDIPAAEPELDDSLRGELEAMRSRAEELRSRQQFEEKPTAPPKPTSPARESVTAGAPIIYEKEHLGFAWSGDHLEPTTSARLADLESAGGLKAPIVDSGQPIGEVFVEMPPERMPGGDEADLAQAIALQASLQIQNLRLLDAAQRARAEAISATRRFTHESWENFLDAIHQREKIGFVYDQNEVNTLEEAGPTESDFEATVSVLEEQVGKLYLQADPGQSLTDQDKALTEAVARQVAQQVENLRLLADASRARAEAEDATRRLTQASWKKYAEEQEERKLGYIYASGQVNPLEDSTLPPDVSIVQPISVRGAAIGQLAVAGLEDATPEAAELVAAIAAQASVHLEALRLTEELQKRAAELQELDRLKSSFLANMSHELRTPLNSILGFSEVMLEGIDGPLTDYMENDLKLIQKNGQHLLHLINDVLDMAKIESGRMNLHPELFRVHDLLEEVFSITSSLANAKNLELAFHPESEKDTEVFADNTRISQVLINLVNNAIKFTDSGGITIRVSTLDRETILIAVKDTGLGIPADHLESIFQEFSQVDTSTTRKVGGTGLGLPISRRLIEMHGGRLWAESTGTAGDGSTFFIELPREAKITEPVEGITR